MRRAQISSLDLILSVIGLILFVSLVLVLVLRFMPSAQPTYGDPFLENLPFLEGSRLDNAFLGSATKDDVIGDRYEASTHDVCVIVLDGSGPVENSDSIGCVAGAPEAGFCEGRIVAHHRKPVLVDFGAPLDNRFGELNVVVCHV